MKLIEDASHYARMAGTRWKAQALKAQQKKDKRKLKLSRGPLKTLKTTRQGG